VYACHVRGRQRHSQVQRVVLRYNAWIQAVLLAMSSCAIVILFVVRVVLSHLAQGRTGRWCRTHDSAQVIAGAAVPGARHEADNVWQQRVTTTINVNLQIWACHITLRCSNG
jgi:hypothetical protein